MALLVLALPLWTGLAVVVWGWMIDSAPALGMSVKSWRTLRVSWAVLAVVTATAFVAGYVRRATATPEESLLYLQDQLWRSTRHEQGTLNRWLVWADAEELSRLRRLRDCPLGMGGTPRYPPELTTPKPRPKEAP